VGKRPPILVVLDKCKDLVQYVASGGVERVF